MGCTYDARQLNLDNCSTWNIYRAHGKWYIAARTVKLKKKYPAIKDTLLFIRDNDPWYELDPDRKNANTQIYYHPISDGTAKVLLMKNGYAHIKDLANEINTTPGEWVKKLTGAQVHSIKAQIEGLSQTSNSFIISDNCKCERSLTNQILSTADFLLIDVPGTAAYNILIPFMAPFKFFCEFSTNN